jgi:hypothetical protein
MMTANVKAPSIIMDEEDRQPQSEMAELVLMMHHKFGNSKTRHVIGTPSQMQNPNVLSMPVRERDKEAIER